MAQKKPLKPPGPMVMIEWRDSCSPFRKWQDTDIGKSYKATTCFSMGWLVRRDKDSTVLVASYGEDQVGDVGAIPTRAVVRVTSLATRKR